MLVLLETTELPQLWVALLPSAPDVQQLEATLSGRITDRLKQAGASYALAQGNGQWLAKFQCLAQVQAALKSLQAGLPLHNPCLVDNQVCLHFRAAYLVADALPVVDAQTQLILRAALSRAPQGLSLMEATPLAREGAESLQRESLIRKALYQAMANSGFYLLYQPLLDLTTGRVASAEALLRIKNSQFGPADFIRVAEATGNIGTVGEVALSLASAFRQVIHKTHPHINLAVNVSAAQLGTASFTAALRRLPQSSGHALELEITESLVAEAAALQHLDQLAEQGHPLAMDDFGAGSASLVQLLRGPLGKVKFDRSILELTVGAPEQLKKLVAVAHEKGCKVVAEGIETPEHLALVQHAGADYGQGYLFARPLPEAELLSRLDQEFSFESYLWKKSFDWQEENAN